LSGLDEIISISLVFTFVDEIWSEIIFKTQEKEIHVIVDQRHLRNSSSESTDKMPIVANELTLAESMQNRTQKAQVFFMSSGGSIKRKLLSDDVSAKKRHIPDTLMPGL
jgi:uncharacterized membrane protein